MTKRMTLVKFLAESCHYAQLFRNHVIQTFIGFEFDDTKPNFSIDRIEREYIFQPVSFQVSCFIAQNTVEDRGVKWDIIMEELVKEILTKKEWRKVIREKAKMYGGWK